MWLAAGGLSAQRGPCKGAKSAYQMVGTSIRTVRSSGMLQEADTSAECWAQRKSFRLLLRQRQDVCADCDLAAGPASQTIPEHWGKGCSVRLEYLDHQISPLGAECQEEGQRSQQCIRNAYSSIQRRDRCCLFCIEQQGTHAAGVPFSVLNALAPATEAVAPKLLQSSCSISCCTGYHTKPAPGHSSGSRSLSPCCFGSHFQRSDTAEELPLSLPAGHSSERATRRCDMLTEGNWDLRQSRGLGCITKLGGRAYFL